MKTIETAKESARKAIESETARREEYRLNPTRKANRKVIAAIEETCGRIRILREAIESETGVPVKFETDPFGYRDYVLEFDRKIRAEFEKNE
jgi:hypothetical protein